MTTQPGTVSRTGVTIGGITALLAMVATYSGAIDYLRGWASGWIHWPNLRAMVVGVGVGVAFTAWVPYVFGRAFCGERARSWMRGGASVITFAAAWSLNQSPVGFWYALFAGLAGAQAFMTGTRLLFRAFPMLEPVALRDGPNVGP